MRCRHEIRNRVLVGARDYSSTRQPVDNATRFRLCLFQQLKGRKQLLEFERV